MVILKIGTHRVEGVAVCERTIDIKIHDKLTIRLCRLKMSSMLLEITQSPITDIYSFFP